MIDSGADITTLSIIDVERMNIDDVFHDYTVIRFSNS